MVCGAHLRKEPVMFFEILGLLAVFALVLLLSYFTTRFVGKKFSGRARNRTMKVIETLPLGLDRSLYLILVGKKYFLFFSSKKGLELVSEIEMEELPEGASQEENPSTNVFDFRKIFETYSGLGTKKIGEQAGGQGEDGNESKAKGILGSIRRLQKINGNKE